MREITLEELLEAGCHFGHQVTRQNPKAREFIFEERDNIHIIDLGKTKEGLTDGAKFLLQTAQNPESSLLVVGTKRQAGPILDEVLATMPEDVRKTVYTVTKRWMGGTLTNTVAISKNYARLQELKEKLHSDEWKQKYTKRELSLFEKEMQKLEAYYGGIVDMKKLPTALFIIDTHTEDLAVKEASRMGIPVVGIVDTNADPDLINYVIPANDDAVGSLKLLISYVLHAWTEGKSGKEVKEAPKTKEVKSSDAKAMDDKKEKDLSTEAPAKAEKKTVKKAAKEEKTK